MDHSNGASLLLLQAQVALRTALALLLEREGYSVCGETASAEVACGMAAELRPDVVLVETCRPGMETVELCGRLRRANGKMGILVYADLGDAGVVDLCLRAGARGFALKRDDVAGLRAAIDSVARGGKHVDGGVPGVASPQTRSSRSELSPREVEVLGMLAGGLTGAQIADRLFLSSETVRTHVRNAMRKLGASTRTHAVVLAFGIGDPGGGHEPRG